MIKPVLKAIMLDPAQALEEAKKVVPGVREMVPAENHTVTKRAKAPAGIAEAVTQLIAKTPEEIRKDDFTSNQPHKANDGDKHEIQIAKEREERLDAIKNGTLQTLNEVLAVNEQSFPDDFQFEKVMLAYYKAMTACMKSQTTAMASAMKELERELEKMSDEREKEYQKILDRMGRQKWFDLLSLGGTVAGGIIGATIASGGATAPAVVAGAAVLGLMQVDKMMNHPMKKAASLFTPEPLMKFNEAVLAVGGTILFGLNPTAVLPAMATNAISQIGMQYTDYQNKVTDGDLEQLSNQSKLDTDKLEDLGQMARFISQTLTSQTKMLRQVMKPPKIFT